jgi:hypothetical protein
MLLKDQELGANLSWKAPFTADLTTTTLLILVKSRNLFFAMVSIDEIDTGLKEPMQLATKGFPLQWGNNPMRCPINDQLVSFATTLVGD